MADDPLITEINVLAEAQQKMVNEQEKEAGAAEQDRSERMETLKKQLANSEHNSKENQIELKNKDALKDFQNINLNQRFLIFVDLID